MFNKFQSIVLQFIIGLTIFGINSCLNITEMNVPSIVWAPEKAVLTCDKQEDDLKESDTFINIHWYKLIDNHWKLIKIYPKPPQEPLKAEEGEGEGEEPPKDTQTEAPKDNPSEEPPKEEETPKEEPKEGEETPKETKPEEKLKEKPKIEKIFKLDAIIETDDTNIELEPTSQSSAGLYKCVLKSTKAIREETKEMRVLFKPEPESKPVLNITKLQDNHISVKCESPPSYPMMALSFFINYEPAPHEDVHRLPAIRKKSTTDGSADELLINVEELRFRATKESVLNGKISIVCTAIFANIYQTSAELDPIIFNGTLYSPKCLTAPIIILIVVVVLFVIIAIIGIVWLYLRKKKLNSLNKVAELFNKQKTITVLIDNNTNDIKVE